MIVLVVSLIMGSLNGGNSTSYIFNGFLKANFTIFKDKQPTLFTNWRGKVYFQCTIMAFRPLFKASILICLQILEEADR